MRSCAPFLLVLLLSASAFAEEPASAERFATAAEMSALEARIDALQADLTRDLEARIESRLSVSYWGGEHALRVGATPASSTSAALAPQADDRSDSSMSCAMADGMLVCSVVGAPSGRIAEASTHR